jgi:hypothetical protein
MVQQSKAVLWDAAAALQTILAVAQDAGELPLAVSSILSERARFIASPALILLAYFAPNRPNLGRIMAERVRGFLLSLHESALPEEHLLDAHEFEPEWDPKVRDAPISMLSYTASWGKRPDSPTKQVVLNLVNIAPTEADVERVFSGLKRNVTRMRTKLLPEHATMALFESNAREFLKAGPAEPRVGEAISSHTWEWLLTVGASAHCGDPRRRAREAPAAAAAQPAQLARAAAAVAAAPAPAPVVNRFGRTVMPVEHYQAP